MPLAASTIWTVLRSPFARGIGVFLALTVVLGGAYMVVTARAVERTERACEMATAAEHQQALTDAIHAQEAAHQQHLAEIERGNAISAELSKTQRRLNETKTEYLAFAHGITGNCPADLGRVLMSYPAPGSDREAGQDSAASAPSDPASTVDAASIAVNIALNRFACETNYAIHSALLQWHAEGVVNE